MKIEDIPTDKFNSILNSYLNSGWKNSYEYKGVDAWIDYGKATLKKEQVTLTFEWDNWSEGWIEGPEEELTKLVKLFL